MTKLTGSLQVAPRQRQIFECFETFSDQPFLPGLVKARPGAQLCLFSHALRTSRGNHNLLITDSYEQVAQGQSEAVFDIGQQHSHGRSI